MSLQWTGREEERVAFPYNTKQQINVEGMMMRKSTFVNSQVTTDADQNHQRIDLVDKSQSISLKIHF